MKQPEQYKITITEIGVEEKIEGKDWEKGAGKKTQDNEDAWGYSPKIEKVCTYQQTIFEQTVKTLDLGAVVSVVNGLGSGK